MTGLRAFWRALLAMWEELFTVLLAGLAGALLLLPIVLGLVAFSAQLTLPALLLLLAGIAATAPLALAGHYALADEIAEEKSVSWRTWWEGARNHWRPAAAWFVMYLGTVAVLVANLRFYGRVDAAWAPWVQGFWLTALFGWLATNLYVMPLYHLQVQKRLRLAFRNAALMAVTDPLSVVVLLFLLGLVTALFNLVAFPLLLLIPPLVAVSGAIAVRLRLQKEGLWKPFGSEAEQEPDAPPRGRAPANRRPARAREIDEERR